MITARVRSWSDEEGWGVVDSAETPGGCWVHYSVVATAGYRSLAPGTDVELEWEAFEQDGHAYRAVRVVPAGAQPAGRDVTEAPGAYRSTLTLTYDDPQPT